MATTMWRNCSSPETMNVCRRESKQLHVLAVDDSNIDRKVIERLLKISSFKVTVVDSGNRALQYLGLDDGDDSSVKFDNLKVNLIMTDYSMPGMTGFELLKKIKKSSIFREIPVVIMSSENILTRIDSCLEEGAEDFLLKPVKLSDVKRLKDFILRGEGEDDPEIPITHKRKQTDESPSTSSQLPSPISCDLLSAMPQSPASQPAISLSKRAKL